MVTSMFGGMKWSRTSNSFSGSVVPFWHTIHFRTTIDHDLPVSSDQAYKRSGFFQSFLFLALLHNLGIAAQYGE